MTTKPEWKLVCAEHGVRVILNVPPAQRSYYCGVCEKLVTVHSTVEV